LTVRAVRRTDNDPPSAVPLVEAVALAVQADPSDESPTTESLLADLRAMPPTVRLFAAVDEESSVIGTAGVGVFGRYGHLIFVNIHLDRRGERVGRAMTALTLADARARGATAAYLDASGYGRRLYDAMGFTTAAALTRFTYLT
jgi:N-acetylglutamate synthase-like GNAT family acetyltransferase